MVADHAVQMENPLANDYHSPSISLLISILIKQSFPEFCNE